MTKSDCVLAEIRKTICFNFDDGETVLHETVLAAEHGMSRTPIRQILQRLAYERLIYTKSGVGSVVTPLKDADRARDFATHRGLLSAALLHDLPELTIAQQSELIALGAMSDAMQDQGADTYYTLMVQLHKLTETLIADPLLQSAISASNWRITRWKLKAAQDAPEQARQNFSNVMKSLTQSPPASGGDILERLAKET